MFTGLVESVGEILSSEEIEAGGRRVTVAHHLTGSALTLGESVAVDGACLTVVSFEQGWFAADLSPETLLRTTLGHAARGAAVNLERALEVGDRLGGHLVTGHVDGVAEVKETVDRGEMMEALVAAPQELAPYIAEKGSVTLAGVSLTVNRVQDSHFSVLLVPHTRTVTTLRTLTPGTRLNLEVDLIARYVQRLLSSSGRQA